MNFWTIYLIGNLIHLRLDTCWWSARIHSPKAERNRFQWIPLFSVVLCSVRVDMQDGLGYVQVVTKLIFRTETRWN